jgi:hypothetical protein
LHLAAKRSQEMSERVKYLDPVIVPIGDDVLADPIDGHAGQAVELAVAVAVAAEAEPVLPNFVEDLIEIFFNVFFSSSS